MIHQKDVEATPAGHFHLSMPDAIDALAKRVRESLVALGGSDGHGDMVRVRHVEPIAVVTILAGAAGAIAAATFMIMTAHKPDPTITMNGLLAGLVASSAAAGHLSPAAAMIIGAIAGPLICLSVQLLDTWRINDPVGAISVHGIVGLWGVLAVGIFANSDSVKGCLRCGWGQLAAQIIGCAVLLLWAGGFSWVFLKTADKFIPMRVAPEAELDGLDIPGTGLVGYPDFQVVSPHPSGFSGRLAPVASRREHDHEKN